MLEHKDSKILFLELGVGRLTPMFIQEPFWNLTLNFPHARYIAVNDRYDFLPKQLEDKGMTIVADIAQVLRDARSAMEGGERNQSGSKPTGILETCGNSSRPLTGASHRKK